MRRKSGLVEYRLCGKEIFASSGYSIALLYRFAESKPAHQLPLINNANTEETTISASLLPGIGPQRLQRDRPEYGIQKKPGDRGADI